MALAPDRTYMLNELIQRLPKVPSLQLLTGADRGLRVAKVFRNKEGHGVVMTHTFNPQHYREVEQSLVAVYRHAFDQVLQVRFSVARNERAVWVVS